MEEGLLTVYEVAQLLRVNVTTVRRWIKGGAMEAVQLPHSGKRQAYRVRKSTLAKAHAAARTLLLPAYRDMMLAEQ